ncbi:MAG TPA: MarC family protein [Methanomassiliicoccaceae archaeon]|jgi:multiple antibiotic resistance protein|nr:MarC family protein [Euryarchaeota archaeon]HOB38956.1 MarC family protein [Methanomassiliicoccaceae archaeon]HOL07109.1 MarC family protein [Methanomassiliicoccaceae archaeon]HOQ25164.1 MarC family protein [Methanomassiliicoccaceae archaeon]HQA21327.1 MarC family protein [Methanomassiliicoccaceae archaeon]
MSDLQAALEFIPGAIIAIIVISNPLSTSAMFLALTQSMTEEAKMRTARKSSYYSLMILMFFAFTGLLLFQIFNFSVGAFRIAGGILLMSTALGMLYPRSEGENIGEPTKDISLMPMSIPFISGPGTIVTVVVLMSTANKMSDGDFGIALVAYMGVILGILILIAISYLVMVHSDRLFSMIRDEGRDAITKLMGLIVLSISIQFIVNGIGDVLPMFVDIVKDSTGIG